MPKLTKEEKEAQRKEQEAKEAAELKLFQETVLPVKLLELMAQANSVVGVSTHVFMGTDGSGVNVKFTFPSTQDDYRAERRLTLKSEPYEVDQVEYEFTALNEREEKARKKLLLAQEVYDRMTPEEREAVGLKSRPR